ncbi:MAG: hypothetical protein Q4E18_06340, partial [Clostridia bacterium]|nr:hypothetical protein [Clostridia bacterium]
TATVSTFRALPSSFCPIPADLFPSKRHAPPRMSFFALLAAFFIQNGLPKNLHMQNMQIFRKIGM